MVMKHVLAIARVFNPRSIKKLKVNLLLHSSF